MKVIIFWAILLWCDAATTTTTTATTSTHYHHHHYNTTNTTTTTCTPYPLCNPSSPPMMRQAPRQFSTKFHTNVGGFIIDFYRDWSPHAVGTCLQQDVVAMDVV
jgi:hypothetical protein